MHAFGTTLPNALSLSRIPAALVFLLVYSDSDASAFVGALALCLFAIVTDILDGYLARKWKLQSLLGYFLDGLGDKSFYTAILIVIAREHPVDTVYAWLLIIREIFLYALRALNPCLGDDIISFRDLSVLHAIFCSILFCRFFMRASL